MDTKKMFEKYWENKAAIVLFKEIIDKRKEELLPSMTPILSHTPKGSSGN